MTLDAPWPDGLSPLAASPSVSTARSRDAERILGELITSHRIKTRSFEGFASTIRSAPVGPIRVISHRYRNFAGVDITGPLELIAMSIPLSGDLAATIDGKDFLVPRGSPMVCNPGAEPRMTGPSAVDFLTVTLPAEVVADAVASRFPRLGRDATIAFDTLASRQAGGALAHAMWMTQAALSAGQARTPEQQKRLVDMVVSSLLLSHPHNLTRELYRAGPRASEAAVWDAVAVLRHSPESRVTIADLARDAGVSTRSLQLGFLRLVGVTPSQFQRDLRLERARALMAEPGRPSVAQIAARVGYVNQGRFAADFRRRFRMTPSEMLRR